MSIQYLRVNLGDVTLNRFFSLLGNSANFTYQLQNGHVLGELNPEYPDKNVLSYLYGPASPNERTFLIMGIDIRNHTWITVGRDGPPPDVIAALNAYTYHRERFDVVPRIVTINGIEQIATFDMYDTDVCKPHH